MSPPTFPASSTRSTTPNDYTPRWGISARRSSRSNTPGRRSNQRPDPVHRQGRTPKRRPFSMPIHTPAPKPLPSPRAGTLHGLLTSILPFETNSHRLSLIVQRSPAEDWAASPLSVPLFPRLREGKPSALAALQPQSLS